MTAQEDTAVRHKITVAAPQAKAFAVFTDGLDLWWPRSHKIGPEALEQAVLEGHEGAAGTNATATAASATGANARLGAPLTTLARLVNHR
jgi:hypothetical protein